MHDGGEIRFYLENAMFSKLNIENVKLNSISPTTKQAVEGLTQGGFIYNEIMKLNPAWMIEIKEKVEKALSDQYGVAPMIAPMSALISRAWK
jgi:hypothetical protein